MDGIKNKVGVEIEFGKYSFMGYDLFSKMILFKNQNLIECGIEVVVGQSVAKNMSSGVGSFNHIHVDMTNRGEADLDIPCLVLGIGCTENEWKGVEEKRKRFETDRDAMITTGEVLGPRRGTRPGPK